MDDGLKLYFDWIRLLSCLWISPIVKTFRKQLPLTMRGERPSSFVLYIFEFLLFFSQCQIKALFHFLRLVRKKKLLYNLSSYTLPPPPIMPYFYFFFFIESFRIRPTLFRIILRFLEIMTVPFLPRRELSLLLSSYWYLLIASNTVGFGESNSTQLSLFLGFRLKFENCIF